MTSGRAKIRYAVLLALLASVTAFACDSWAGNVGYHTALPFLLGAAATGIAFVAVAGFVFFSGQKKIPSFSLALLVGSVVATVAIIGEALWFSAGAVVGAGRVSGQARPVSAILEILTSPGEQFDRFLGFVTARHSTHLVADAWVGEWATFAFFNLLGWTILLWCFLRLRLLFHSRQR